LQAISVLRRNRIGLQVAGALLSLFLPLPGPAAEMAKTPSSEPPYRLRFYYIHTGERLEIVYRRGSAYIPEATAKLDHYLRDPLTGDVHSFDPRLFDLLYDLTRAVGHAGGEIVVVCGYRTPWTNAFLRRRTSGVALHSLHMQAMAIDIRMPGVPTSQLRAAALALQRGGVGYYPQSDFIHVDVGRVRQW
jgi:uncharacterized protein YcbK (DUF882 family)